MEPVLIGWTCGHFVVFEADTSAKAPLASVFDDASDVFGYLAETADTDLATVSTDSHMSNPKFCPNCDQDSGRSSSFAIWKSRAQ